MLFIFNYSAVLFELQYNAACAVGVTADAAAFIPQSGNGNHRGNSS